MLTGAMGYGVGTWATPISITMGMTYDVLGYHDVVERYLQGVREAQGTLTPPGNNFKQHPGYLSLPPRVCVIPWLSDHGALLWLISNHALLSGDRKIIDEWTPVIIKACEWIKYARGIQDHSGVKGIMPPGGYSDDESRVQSVQSDSWIYKGLTTSVKLLKSINHPRADEFDREAKEYKAAFVKAYNEKLPQMGTWTGPDGKVRHLSPMFISKESEWQLRHVFYLDAGPLQLVWGGLLDADDQSMKVALLWFREGPPKRMARLELDYLSMPFLYHEVSSWEVCYSWNIFHSWQKGDRQRFLEGMYAMATGGYSQQTFSACEERGGMLATTNWLPTIWHLRNSVIDDQIADGELHLLRLVPLAWLKPDREAKFVNMPTNYGPVTLKAKLGADGKTLNVTFSNKTPSIAPRWDGSHLVTAWEIVRDMSLYWPWYDRTRRGVIWRDAAIDAASVDVRVQDLLKIGDAYQEAYAASFRYPMRERLGKLRVPCLAVDYAGAASHPRLAILKAAAPHCEIADLWQVSFETWNAQKNFDTNTAVHFLVRWRPPYHFKMVNISDKSWPGCTQTDPEADAWRTLFATQEWRW
jgi:hypothetical protein